MLIRSKYFHGTTLAPYAFSDHKDGKEYTGKTIKMRSFLLDGVKSVHSCSITSLNQNGKDRAIAWFGGSREGARDVNIYLTRLINGDWDRPRVVASPSSTMIHTFKYIKKVGNPVLVFDKKHQLHLFYVTTSIGGWSTSQIQHLISKDKGITWTQRPTLTLSPFFNISTLVRTNPVFRADGSFDIPVYSELIRKLPEVLHFSTDGNLLTKIRMTSEGRFLQPSITISGPRTAFALERDGTKGKKIHYQQTVNNGLKWSSPVALTVPNPGSSIAVARIPNGKYAMIFNPNSKGRSILALAISNDGINWKTVHFIENSPNKEFSYPSLIASGNSLDACYTKNRREIGYLQILPDKF